MNTERKSSSAVAVFLSKNQSFPVCIKDTQRENTFSNKSQALTESTNMDIWVIGILNQLFISLYMSKVAYGEKSHNGALMSKHPTLIHLTTKKWGE